MQRDKLLVGVAALVAMLLAVPAAAQSGAGAPAPEPAAASDHPEPCMIPQGASKIASAKFFIEYNATDGDVGVQGFFDDDGYSELCVLDPNGRPILVIEPRGELRDLNIGNTFFESREPPLAQFSIADLKAAFPQGRYKVHGRTFEGRALTGSALFTHAIPAAAKITSPKLAEEPEQTGGAQVPRAGLVIDWNRVTQTVDRRPVRITGYEVIVTKEVPDDPNGFSRPTYDVHVPPSLTSLSVPQEFLQPNTVYELEVLALEQSGNQTISVGFFRTR